MIILYTIIILILEIYQKPTKQQVCSKTSLFLFHQVTQQNNSAIINDTHEVTETMISRDNPKI